MQSQSDIEELRTLQREAEQLRVKRHAAAETGPLDEEPATAKSEAGQPPGQKKARRKRATATADEISPIPGEGEKGTTQGQEVAGDEAAAESDQIVRDLARQIDSVVKELEEAARDRPAIALLTAFTIGIVVGAVFSRR